MSNNKTSVILRSFMLILPLLTACSGVKFAEEDPLASQKANSCTNRDIASITRMTKILFLVDTSGSNVIYTRNEGTVQCFNTDIDFLSCAFPTDPNKTFRAGAIQTFLNDYANKENFQWGFINFAGEDAYALINSSGNDQNPYLSTSVSAMQSAINSFYSIQDNYATPYQAALEMAKKAVATDRDLNSASNPQYLIVMLTDGFPTDYNAFNGSFDVNAVHSDINSLVNIAPGRVSLSTIYYGHNNQNAINLLSSMAQTGNGQFANVNNTSTGIKIDNVLSPGGTVCE